MEWIAMIPNGVWSGHNERVATVPREADLLDLRVGVLQIGEGDTVRICCQRFKNVYAGVDDFTIGVMAVVEVFQFGIPNACIMQHNTIEITRHAGIKLISIHVDRMSCDRASKAKVAPRSNLFSYRARAAKDRLRLVHRQALERIRHMRENFQRKCLVRRSERTGADLDA